MSATNTAAIRLNKLHTRHKLLPLFQTKELSQRYFYIDYHWVYLTLNPLSP
jgi:hypothetical protein